MPDRLNCIQLLVVALLHKAHQNHYLGHGHLADLLLVVDLELLVHLLQVLFESAQEQVMSGLCCYGCCLPIDIFAVFLDSFDFCPLPLQLSLKAVFVELILNLASSFHRGRLLGDLGAEEALGL